MLFSPVLRTNGLLGPIDGRHALGVTNAYLLAFFGRYLDDKVEPLLRGPSSRYPEVQFESRRGQGRADPACRAAEPTPRGSYEASA